MVISWGKQIGCAVALAAALTTGTSSAQSLPDSFRQMLKNDPELRAAEWDTLAAEFQAKAVKGQLFPQVGISASTGFSRRDRSIDGLDQDGSDRFSRQVGISLRQLLFDGNGTLNTYKAAKQRAELQSYLSLGAREDRAVDLTEVYLEVLRTREQIRAAKENVVNHRHIYQMAVARFEGGGEASDSALLEGRLSLAESTLQTQRLQLQRAEARFQHLVGIAPKGLKKPATPKVSTVHKDLDFCGNWNYRAAKVGYEAARLDTKVSRSAYMPKFYADIGYSAGEDNLGIQGRDNEFHALVVARWDVFTSGTNKANVGRSNAIESKHLDLIDAALRDAKMNSRLLLLNLEGTSKAYTSLNRYQTRLAKVVSDYQDGFNLGRRDILEILDMKGEYYSAQNQLIDARYEMMAGRFRLLGMTGGLADYFLAASASGKQNNYSK